MKFLILSIYSLLAQTLFSISRNGLINFWGSKKQQFNDRSLRDFESLQIGNVEYLFFCSSAGEYEQALPVINRISLAKGSPVKVAICFFSRSGIDYLKKTNSKLPAFLSPPDTLWHWARIFNSLAPKKTIVVRHELWPCFLYTAKQRSQLVLINASIYRFRLRVFKKLLLGLFDKIFVVNSDHFQKFNRRLSIPKEKMCITGDTKYDRVLDRKKSNPAPCVEEEIVRKIKLANATDRKKLILGSAWQTEIQITLQTYLGIRSDSTEQWLIIIAPHDTSPAMIQWIRAECQRFHLMVHQFSEINDQLSTAPAVLVIDRLGLLASFYQYCDICFVGGGFGTQVHNVLEPTVFGLVTAFGPNYKRVHEARDLVENNIATVIETREDFAMWWQNHFSIENSMKDKISKSVHSMAGSSERIVKELKMNRASKIQQPSKLEN